MNRRKFLKALFSIPLLAVVPKVGENEKKPTGQQADITILDDIENGFIWPSGGPDDIWTVYNHDDPGDNWDIDCDATYDLINGTDNPECKFEGLRGFITTGKEQLQQLDDYSKTPFMEMQIEKMREIVNEFVEQSL